MKDKKRQNNTAKNSKAKTGTTRVRRIEKRMGGIEKLLFFFLILLFAASCLGLYMGDYMKADPYFQFGMGMTLVSIAILSLEKFVYSKNWNRKITTGYEASYWLIIVFALTLGLQYEGIVDLGLMQVRSIWMIVPGASLIWITKLVFGDVAFIDYDSRKEAEKKQAQTKKKGRK